MKLCREFFLGILICLLFASCGEETTKTVAAPNAEATLSAQSATQAFQKRYTGCSPKNGGVHSAQTSTLKTNLFRDQEPMNLKPGTVGHWVFEEANASPAPMPIGWNADFISGDKELTIQLQFRPTWVQIRQSKGMIVGYYNLESAMGTVTIANQKFFVTITDMRGLDIFANADGQVFFPKVNPFFELHGRFTAATGESEDKGSIWLTLNLTNECDT